MALLKVTNLTKTFLPSKRLFFLPSHKPSFTAVRKLSLELNEGEFLGLLGPNGAGKTTTIEMLLGTLIPTSGKIEYFGKDFAKHRHETLERVTHASAYHKLPSNLTVWQTLFLFGRIYCLSSETIRKHINELGPQFGVETLFEKKVMELSAGQTTRVMLLKAFLPKPKIVLLDEPTASLDPDIAFDLRQYILEQREKYNISVILTSHNMEEVSQLCDRVLVLKNGEIIEEDTPEKLAKSVAQCSLILEKPTKIETLISIIQKNGHPFTAHGERVEIEIDEKEVAKLLHHIACAEILYEKISISPPTLEDFFIHIARQK